MKQKIINALFLTLSIINASVATTLIVLNGFHTTKDPKQNVYFVCIVAIVCAYIIYASVRPILIKDFAIKKQLIISVLLALLSIVFMASLNCARCISEDYISVRTLERSGSLSIRKCTKVDVHYFYFIKIDFGKDYCFNTGEPLKAIEYGSSR